MTVAVAAYFGILPVIADIAFHASRPALAVQLDQLQARYHQALGERLVAGGRLSAGIGELRRAGDLGDDDAAMWVELGDAEHLLGDEAAAQAAYSKARAIDPAILRPD